MKQAVNGNGFLQFSILEGKEGCHEDTEIYQSSLQITEVLLICVHLLQLLNTMVSYNVAGYAHFIYEIDWTAAFANTTQPLQSLALYNSTSSYRLIFCGDISFCFQRLIKNLWKRKKLSRQKGHLPTYYYCSSST